MNEDGESEWSVGAFQTTPPAIEVTAPNGGESLWRGLDYFLRWEENIAEDVVIELYRNESLVQVVDTVSGTVGVYEWEVDLDLEPGGGYFMKVRSDTRPELFAISDSSFAIDPPFFTGVALTNGVLILEWTNATEQTYIEFAPSVDSLEWTEIAGPLDGTSWSTDLPSEPVGFYRLRQD